MDVTMQTPPLDPDVADTAPTTTTLTGYDEQHLITYLRLLDAESSGGVCMVTSISSGSSRERYASSRRQGSLAVSIA
jgi:hypothetical protein